MQQRCTLTAVLGAGQQIQQAKHLDLQGKKEADPCAVGKQPGWLVGFAQELQLTSRRWSVSGRAAVGGVIVAAWLFPHPLASA